MAAPRENPGAGFGSPTEPALRRLLEVGRWLVSDLDLERILGRVLEAAVDLTGARYAALGVLDPSRGHLEQFVHRGIDDDTRKLIGDLPRGRGVLGLLISTPEPLRLPDVSAHPESFGFPEGHPPMASFLGVPITVGGGQWGNLYLTEKRGAKAFSEDDERIAVGLAEWAAVAITNARSVATQRLRFAMDAAEQERLQWARELHDQTLQGLAAVRLLLASGTRAGGKVLEDSVGRSIEQIDAEIAAMRALISDLRPDSLEELGVASSVRGLVERMRQRAPGIEIGVDAPAGSFDRARVPRPVETALYRVCQEALTNAIRHGEGSRIDVALKLEDGFVSISVRDDGSGFDIDDSDLGYGIIGMRERAELAGGDLIIDSTPGRGTEVVLRVPLA